ncbi:MAG: heme-binding beta-barrel domain-containing protein, partial [Propionibacteriaceae bacterium]
WYGKITGAKIELATDAVVRTVSADDYSAGQRLYGNVEGDLLWTFDKAALGQPLQTNLWARLTRV